MKSFFTFGSASLLLCLTWSTAHASLGDSAGNVTEDESQSNQATSASDDDPSNSEVDGNQSKKHKQAAAAYPIEFRNGVAWHRCPDGMWTRSTANCDRR